MKSFGTFAIIFIVSITILPSAYAEEWNFFDWLTNLFGGEAEKNESEILKESLVKQFDIKKALLENPFTQFGGFKQINYPLAGIPVSVGIDASLGEFFKRRVQCLFQGPSNILRLVPAIDHVFCPASSPLAIPYVYHRQAKGGRLHDTAGRIPDHRSGVPHQIKVMLSL